MKITSEKMQLSILRQLSQGKIPEPSYYEQLGATKEEFGAVVAGMREKNYIRGGDSDQEAWESPDQSASLDGSRITMAGENFLSRETELTEAYRELEE